MKGSQKAARLTAVKLPVRVEQVEAEQLRVMRSMDVRWGPMIPAVLRVK